MFCSTEWVRTTSWTWWQVKTCPSVSGQHWWDQTSPLWMPWPPPAHIRQSSKASSTSVRTSSTISCWLTGSLAPPPLYCPLGEELQPTPAWLEATHAHQLRPQLPMSSLPPHLSSHTMGLQSTTTTITSIINPHPAPHLQLLSHQSQPCCHPPYTPITPLQNNTHCETEIKAKME